MNTVFNRLSLLLLILLAGLWQVQALASVTGSRQEALLTNRIIIKYHNDLSFTEHDDDSARRAKKAQREVIWQRFYQLTGQTLTLVREMNATTSLVALSKTPSKTELEGFIALLESDAEVEYAEPDRLLQIMQPRAATSQ